MIYDVVHGTFDIPPIVEAIIQTKEFQRLKKVRQLGFAPYSATRYEHSLGTYYLARKLLDSLEENSSRKITEFLKQCVTLAGLLHDIGHGPFSHFWEQVSSFRHEENGIAYLRKIFQYDSCKLLDHERAVKLIEALILGDMERAKSAHLESSDEFALQIISNSKCKIDVDKWDYLLRDSYYTNNEHYLDFVEMFEDAKISSDGKDICYNGLKAENVAHMWELRKYLHLNVYQLPHLLAKEKIFVKIFDIVDRKNYLFKGKSIKNITCEDDEFLDLYDELVLKWLHNLGDPEITSLLNYVNNNLTDLSLLPRDNISISIKYDFSVDYTKIKFYGQLDRKSCIIPSPVDKTFIYTLGGD